MSMLIKWGGRWVNLDVKTGNANIANFVINSQTYYREENGLYKFSIELNDIDYNSMASLILNY
jgi:hypothetical protein